MCPQRSLSAGLVVLLAISVVAGGCQGGEPTSGSEQTVSDTMTAETTDVDSTDRDTTAADSASRSGAIAPGPAPGTVRVRASVASCDTTRTPVHCQLQITEVLAYGSSTPVIGTGERTVRVSTALLSDRPVDELKGNSYEYVLRHRGDQQAVREGEERTAPTEWGVRSINTE